MQPQAPRLQELLGRLAQERGMVGKVRTLAGAWPLLRQLSSSERDQVALSLGSSWARKHLDRFVTSSDLPPHELKLQKLLSRIESADPAELRSMARKLRRGEIRDLGGRFAAGLVETLEGEAQSAERKILKEALAAQRPEIPSALPPPPQPSTEAPDVDEALPETDPAESALESIETAEPGEERLATIESEEDTSGSEVGPLDLAAPKKALEIPAEAAAKNSQEVRDFKSGPEHPVVPTTTATTTRTAPATATQALRLLRSLRPDGDATPSTPQARAELIGKLGRGWAARRGIAAMIRSGAVEQLEEALQLIVTLENPTAEFWCLADLLETWDLAESDIQRLLAACPSAPGRRRLERRFRRRALSA